MPMYILVMSVILGVFFGSMSLLEGKSIAQAQERISGVSMENCLLLTEAW